MTLIDLHMHSIHSDGKQTCSELIEEVKEKGIGLFSLTDHDTIEGISEMKQLAQGYHIDFVPGVEIAVTHLGKEYHLTTYAYNEEHKGFKELIDYNLGQRLYFDQEIIKALKEDYPVSLSEFEAFHEDKSMGGWPSLNYLKSKCLIKDIKDYFKLTSPYQVKLTFKSPLDVIPILKDAGAKVFLAHPSAYFKSTLSEDILDYFRGHNIDGVECYSPYLNSDEELKYYLDYCERHHLKISGGSDYHGGFVSRKMGYPSIEASMISHEFFKQLIKR